MPGITLRVSSKVANTIRRGEAVLRTAVRSGLSAYDAQFVVVAEGLSVTLVTGDREIARGLSAHCRRAGELC